MSKRRGSGQVWRGRARAVTGTGVRQLRWGVVFMCAMAVAVSTLAIEGGAVATSLASATNGSPLHKGLAFYKGKSIEFIVPGAAGGGTDKVGRAYAMYMATYLHASSYVVDSNGPTQAGLNLAYASAPNGLAIGVDNVNSLVGDWLGLGHEGLNFNPRALSFIGFNDPGLLIWASLRSSPYTSIRSVIDATNSPSETVIVNALGVNDMLFKLLGAKVTFLTAYANTNAATAGFERGDGPLTNGGLDQLGPLLGAGIARALAVSSFRVALGTAYREDIVGVPTTSQLMAKYAPKTKAGKALAKAFLDFVAMDGNALTTPPGVSNDKLVALQAAMLWTSKQTGFKQLMTTQGENPMYLAPHIAKATMLNLLAEPSSISCYFVGTCGT